MSVWVDLVAASGSTRAIPFRDDGGSAASSITAALLVTVLMLALLALAAIYARKRGWLDRWVGQTRAAHAKPSMQVAQVLRLSPRTTLYRVHDGTRVLLVLESAVNAQVVADTTQVGAGADDGRD